MSKRILSALTAFIITGSALTSAVPASNASAADQYELAVSVSTKGSRKEISPYLYGVNSQFRAEEYLYDA